MLTHIFKQSIKSDTVPSQWKHAYITLIFKKGIQSDPRNYCPISLTSAVCKVMEHNYSESNYEASGRSKHSFRQPVWI